MNAVNALADHVRRAGGARGLALFLDFDGTLVELAATPDAVAPAPRLRPLLAGLFDRLAGAVAIVTGRPVAVVDAFLDPLRLPIAGLHGMEVRLRAGGETRSLGLSVLDPVRQGVADLPARLPGVAIEDKGATLAIHYRAVPERGPEVRARALELCRASAMPLQLLDGKMVVELLPAGRDKGAGIRELHSAAPFAGRLPLFLGDDVTDEAGFRAVNELAGVSVRVGSPLGATEARYRLADVAAVHALLGRLLELAPATSVTGRRAQPELDWDQG